MTSFQQGSQQAYEYHAVDNFEIRVENRNSGCWSSSSVKLVQLCCIGILFPIVWILVPVYARLLSYSQSTVPLTFTQMYMIDSKFSTFWCQGHHLYTNTTFNAYLMEEEPAVFLQDENLTRHFELNDDLKEYWGTYLPKGSELVIKSCARHLGATVMLVQANSSGLSLCLNEKSRPGSSEEGTSEINKNVSQEHIIHHVNSRHLSKKEQKIIIPSFMPLNNNTIKNDSDQTILDRSATSSNLYEEVDDVENGAFEEDDLSIEYVDSTIRPSLIETSLSEEGLTSSSEEDLLACALVIITKPVFPDENCSADVNSSKHSLIRYLVDEAGYYTIIFSSTFEQRGKEKNPVSVQINLQKATFNTTTAVSNCHNTTECQFGLRFASSQRIVVALSTPLDEDSDFNNSIFSVESECIPRTPIYLAFGLTLPLALILCAFL